MSPAVIFNEDPSATRKMKRRSMPIRAPFIGGARRVRLTFAEGGESEAQVLGDDLDTDLALPTHTATPRLVRPRHA